MRPRKPFPQVIIGLVLACLLLADGRAVAEEAWFSDFMDNVIVNDPTMFETQKRGYMSLGGIAYRNPKSTEPLISITAPRFQAGCGGIDAFWGGLSYLQPEYIIKAFEQIMSAAPGYAFKLALKTLCEQCDNAMTALEGLANAANALAMDDCKAAQGLVNAGGDAIASTLNTLGVQGLAPDGNWMGSKIKTATQTVGDWTTKLDSILDWQFCGGIGNHDPDALARCKAELVPQGAMWNAALKDEGDWLTKVVRGMFGDLIVTPPGGKNDGEGGDVPGRTAGVEMIIPCVNAASDSLAAFLDPTGGTNAKIWVRTCSDTSCGECEQIDLPDSMKFGKRASDALDDLSNKMVFDPTGDLDPNTVQMIGQNSLPIYQILNAYAYRFRDSGALISNAEKSALSSILAVGHTQYLLDKMVSRANMYMARYAVKKLKAASVTAMDESGLKLGIDNVQRRIADFRGSLMEQLRLAMGKYKDDMDELAKYENMKKQLMSVIKNKGLVAAYWGP